MYSPSEDNSIMMLMPLERWRVTTAVALLMLVALAVLAAPAFAQSGPPAHGGGEANLKIPDLGQVQLLGVNGRTLLLSGLAVCVLGLVFGLFELR